MGRGTGACKTFRMADQHAAAQESIRLLLDSEALRDRHPECHCRTPSHSGRVYRWDGLGHEACGLCDHPIVLALAG